MTDCKIARRNNGSGRRDDHYRCWHSASDINWQNGLTSRCWKNCLAFKAVILLKKHWYGKQLDLMLTAVKGRGQGTLMMKRGAVGSIISIFPGVTCQRIRLYYTCFWYSPAEKARVSSSNHHWLTAVLETWWSGAVASINLATQPAVLSVSRFTGKSAILILPQMAFWISETFWYLSTWRMGMCCE